MVRLRRLAVVMGLAAGIVHAQQPDNGMKAFLKDYGATQKEIWLSPFKMSRRTMLTRAVPLALGTAGLFAVDRRISRGLPNTDDQVKWSNRISHIGGLYTLAAVTAVPLIAARSGNRPYAASVGRASIDALAASVTVNYALKYSLGRERPYNGAGNGPFFRGGDSFPSGHSMTTWAVCTAIARHRNTPRWAKVVSYAVAATVSLSRLGGRRHFSSDVFAGAVLGGWIGNRAAQKAP